jgi:hypothetical protein
MIITLKEEEIHTILREYVARKYTPGQDYQIRTELRVDNEPAIYFSVEFLKGSPE